MSQYEHNTSNTHIQYIICISVQEIHCQNITLYTQKLEYGILLSQFQITTVRTLPCNLGPVQYTHLCKLVRLTTGMFRSSVYVDTYEFV